MDLFLDRAPGLTKEAAFAARLTETPDNWPQELTSELLKQLPFLSDYDVNVVLDRVDQKKGAGFGFADVTNKTERPEVEHTEAGIPHIRIPIVVQERAVKPFSIFLDGERVLPLTEQRVRELLFNPATFDLSATPPRDPSLVETLMPPQRSGIGMGGEYKMASAEEDFVADMTVERWMKDAAEMLDDKEKLAFGHISKDQWKAIYQSKDVQKAVQKYGNPADKQVTNVAYQLASKHYGFFPKIPEMNQEDMMKMRQQAAAKTQKAAQPPSGGVKKTAGIGSRLLSPVRKAAEEGASTAFKKHGPKLLAGSAAVGAGGGIAASRLDNTWRKEKSSSLLIAIAPTLREIDVEKFTEKIANDPDLIAGFRKNGISTVLVQALENTKRASVDDRLTALADAIAPTVITLQKLPGGDFLVKSAARNAFADGEATRGKVVPEEEAAEAMGPDLTQQMQPGQTATAVADPAQAVEPAPTKAKVIEEFGQYMVQDAMGNPLVGHVFPHVLSWDDQFSEQPISLFTNGSAYALQETIAGELVGKGVKLPGDAPRGDGVFYTVKDGDAICTAPITIGSSAAGPDGLPHFIGTDVFGQQIQVSQTEGLREPQRVSDVEYALPADWKFMRLNNQTQLVPDPLQMNKQAEARAEKNSVVLFFNGGFNLKGGCGLEKISSDLLYDMDPVHTEFMLGLLGVEGGLAKVKIAEARKRGAVKIAGLHSIQLLSERFSEAEKTASSLMEEMPELRRDLTKEAAEIEDENTVDNLLALNFINPENLTTFISYMPELEATSEKLAEMLLFSYVGEKSLPEGAIDRSMKNLEEVLTGLKAISHAES